MSVYLMLPVPQEKVPKRAEIGEVIFGSLFHPQAWHAQSSEETPSPSGPSTVLAVLIENLDDGTKRL